MNKNKKQKLYKKQLLKLFNMMDILVHIVKFSVKSVGPKTNLIIKDFKVMILKIVLIKILLNLKVMVKRKIKINLIV